MNFLQYLSCSSTATTTSLVKLISTASFFSIVSACAGGVEPPSRSTNLGKSDSENLKKANEMPKDNSRKKDGTSDGSIVSPCDSMWLLALKQQPVGAKFEYTISTIGPRMQAPYFLTRINTISASSIQRITYATSVSDGSLNSSSSGHIQFRKDMSADAVSLTKEQFVDACQNSNSKVVGLNGGVEIKEQSNAVISIAGAQLNVRQVKAHVTNLRYANLWVTGDMELYVSPAYPSFILKHKLIIAKAVANRSNSNDPATGEIVPLEGVVFEETLKSGLPGDR